MDDPSYRLEIAETLTIKPHGLMIRAKVRGRGDFARDVSFRSGIPSASMRPLVRDDASFAQPDANATPLLVLYGSNTGASEMFARRIAADASRQGYSATVAPLDEYVDGLSNDVAVIAITASYEGQAPDNAKKFLSWIESRPAGELAAVKFAVFGCGNRQWARTYQFVPKRVDAAFEAAGATRLRPRGEADAGGDFFGAFDQWYEGLWADLGRALGVAVAEKPAAPAFDVEVLKAGRESMLQLSELEQGTIVENRELIDRATVEAARMRSKRHLQIALPAGMHYRAGDYLAVLPRNAPATVKRALRRFGLANDTQIVIRKQSGAASLPTDYPISAFELLSNYVELAQPATRAQIHQLVAATPCQPESAPLAALAEEEHYTREILDKRVSVLDLLERTQSCTITLSQFLAMLPLLRARQYSISSSPLVDETQASLTIAVVDAPSMSGQGRFLGVASTYLASLTVGDRLAVAVRPSQSGFHPPPDPSVPIVMVCAGTGVAPFRGFLQERAAQKAAGRTVGRALLFFGVDHPEVDYLYRDEFAAWEAAGVVEIRPAFSSRPEGDVVFVQHRVWKDRAEVAQLFRDGAQFYVCGDGRYMAPGVRETFIRIYQRATQASDADANAWADRMEHEHGRYVSDVFA
jgi:cytochrome P450/NADPH-cytochrome P450 reductase